MPNAAIPWVTLALAALAAAVAIPAAGSHPRAAPQLLLVLATDGAPAAIVLLAALGWGAFPARRLNAAAPLAKQLCLALAIGLGLLGAVTLALGCAGGMSQTVAAGLLAVGAALALVFGAGLMRERQTTAPASAAHGWTLREALTATVALLPLAAPLGVALFAACLPPGLVWYGEGRGYDVLEYHLQVPREWFDAGRIQFLPHNVYASFPQQVEIFSYLLMYLLNDAHTAAIPAQLLHVGLGVAFVLSAVAWAPPKWPRVLVALAAGGVPWLAYLGPLAYVENGVLFFGAVAAGVALDQLRGAVACGHKAALASGLCAGLACGCKYTAIGMVAASLGAAWLAMTPGGAGKRARLTAFFSAGVVAAFAPWAARNLAFAGNPIHPFAYSYFGGAAWSAEQARQWAQGHALQGDVAGLGARGATAARELIGSFEAGGWRPSHFGLVLYALALVAAARRRDRATWMLLLFAAATAVVWGGATHMPGRFAVPLMVPLAFLAGGAAECSGAPRREAGARLGWTAWMALGAAAAVAGQAWIPVALLNEHRHGYLRQTNVALEAMLGRTDIMLLANPLQRVPAGARTRVVGEARAYYMPRAVSYTVVFSRDPWLEFAEGRPPAEAVEWLRTRGVTNVVFCWSEIARLRATYGFVPFVTPEWVQTLTRHGLVRLATEQETGGYDVYGLTN